MSEMIATANATRACAKNPPDTGYPVSGGSVILRLYGGSAQRLLFGERLVPDLNGLELWHPAVRFKLAFPCIQQTLLHAPLSGLGLLGIGDVCKGGLCGGFGLALLSPDEQCQLAAVCGDGRACRQQVVQDDAGGDLVAAPDCCAANNNSCNCAANALRGLAACSSRPRLSSPARNLRVRSFM